MLVEALSFSYSVWSGYSMRWNRQLSFRTPATQYITQVAVKCTHTPTDMCICRCEVENGHSAVSWCAQSSPWFCSRSETSCWRCTSPLAISLSITLSACWLIILADDTTVLSSANLMTWFELCISVQSWVNKCEKQWTEYTALRDPSDQCGSAGDAAPTPDRLLALCQELLCWILNWSQHSDFSIFT